VSERRSSFPAVALLFAFICSPVTVSAQTPNLPPGAGRPLPPSTHTRPDSIQDSNLYTYWSQMSAQARVGGALFGKIVVEGEPLPWEPILVAVTCSGKVVHQTQTDARGNFGIVPTSVPGAISIQGDSLRQMETHYEGCLVQGVVSGFGSKPITITARNLRDEPDIGVLAMHRMSRDAATTVSSTSDSVPEKAMKAFEKARADMIEGNPDEAQRNLEKSVKLYPGFAEAWLQLGKLQASSDPQKAREYFSNALAADPKFVLPHEQIALLAAQSENWKDVLASTNKVMQLYPDGTPQAWYLNALANYHLGSFGPAQTSAARCLAIDPRHTVLNAEQLLAVILARKGDLNGALTHLRSSLAYVPAGPSADLVKQQIAKLEERLAK
jgi:Tfp pilus assembly protein PilF